MIKDIEFEQTLMDSLTKCPFRKDEDVFVNDYNCFSFDILPRLKCVGFLGANVVA